MKLLKYQIKVFFKGVGFVMPIIITAIFLYASYIQKPLDMNSSFVLSGVFLFLIMSAIGLYVAQQENDDEESLLMLKLNSQYIYYTVKLLFLAVIAMIFTGICLIYPLIINIFNNFDLFSRKLIVKDVLSFIMIVGSMSICGAFFGNFFHPRVLKDRKLTVGLLILLIVLAIARDAIISEVAFTKYILWLLPDIMYPARLFSKAEEFNITDVLKSFLMIMGYAVACGLLKSMICAKRKFS